MRYLIKVNNRIEYEIENHIGHVINRTELKPFFDKYIFIGTDHSPEHYAYLFVTAREKRRMNLWLRK